MNIFELSAVLTLNKTDYEKGLDDSEKKGNSWADKLQNVVGSKAVATFALIGKAVLEVAKKINQLMLDTINYADSVSNLAAKYGLSTDSISEMQYIADQSSTSVEGLTSAMSMLYMRAKQDGDAFKQLGINVKDNNGNFRNMDELFYETIGVLNSFEDEGAKSAYMLDFFGRSAMSVGEVVRKSSEELAQMRQEAHDLGIVMSEETVQSASDFNDQMAVLKLQGKSALAELIAGTPDAEEKLQNFFDNVLVMLEGYAPKFVNFALRLVIQGAIAIVRIAPSLAADIFDVIIDTIFDINWLQVGIDIGKSILEGFLNIWGSLLNKIPGVNIPKVDLGVGENYFEGIDTGEEYEISENVKQDITVKVEASGDSTVSEETAEKTAEALAPYIDKILGGY